MWVCREKAQVAKANSATLMRGSLAHTCLPEGPDLLSSLEAELEPLKEQLRGVQELAASSQQKAALLGEELASAAGARDRTIAELHRSRLEVAEANGRLSELSLHMKEEKCQWSKERTGLLQSMEVGVALPVSGTPNCSWVLWEERGVGEILGGLEERRMNQPQQESLRPDHQNPSSPSLA